MQMLSQEKISINEDISILSQRIDVYFHVIFDVSCYLGNLNIGLYLNIHQYHKKLEVLLLFC